MAPSKSDIAHILRFLEDEKLGYGAMYTARCALSVMLPQIDGQTDIDKVTLMRLAQSAWRPGTVKLYAHYIKKWQLFVFKKKLVR